MKDKDGTVNDLKVDLLTGKQAYPYCLNTSIKRMHSIKKYPPKDAFNDGLCKEPISDELYNRGKLAFEEFECESLYDFCCVYCHGDTLALCEIWHNYRVVNVLADRPLATVK